MPDDALLIRFVDSEAAVEHQVNWVIRAIDETCETTVLGENEAEAVWAEVADFDQRARHAFYAHPGIYDDRRHRKSKYDDDLHEQMQPKPKNE